MTKSRIRGLGTKQGYLLPVIADHLDTSAWDELIEFEPADQVVIVGAGMPIGRLQSILAEHGHCLPLPNPELFPNPVCGIPGTVGGLLATNLPHGLEAQCGSPRDWILGCQFQTPDGTLAKAGSKVVKSVAGYDLHRAAVGSWGRGLAFRTATLRTFPIRALPTPEVQVLSFMWGETPFIQRTLRTEFDDALHAAPSLLGFDTATCTLWCAEPPEPTPGGWILGPHERWTRPEDVVWGENQWRNAFDPERRFV